MNKNIEILIIKLEDRFIGMDCGEINKVISMLKNDNEKEMISEFRENNKLFNLAEMMNSNSSNDSRSFIFTKMENGNDIAVSVPDISNILKMEIEDILVVPEFIRRRQNPFFVWGFFESENKLISLVTFSFFNRG